MKAFVDNGFRNADLKALNFVRKFIKVILVADLSTADGKRISSQAYEGTSSNGLRKELVWPKVLEELPASFITLWKSVGSE